MIADTRLLLPVLVLLPLSLGIRRDMVYEACKRDPTLAFCDSHILGKPPKSKEVISSTISPFLDPFKEMKQWLEGFKDNTDDDEGEIEKSRHLHADKQLYCHKYQANYHHYCSTMKDKELEGVLNQFCDAYKASCAGIIPGIEGISSAGKVVWPRSHVQKTEAETSTSHNDKTEEYCRRFQSQYGNLCSPASKQTTEFCQSFKDNCLAESVEEKTPTTTSTPDEGFLEESFPEDIPTTEGAGSQLSGRVSDYCEKYTENYNYYCVGDTSGTNDKFCNSYRKNCPDKVHS